MSRKITAGILLQQAKQGLLFVHRYKWSHDGRRKLTRRMRKDGLLVLVYQTADGFMYRAAKEGERAA